MQVKYWKHQLRYELQWEMLIQAVQRVCAADQTEMLQVADTYSMK